MTKKNKWLLGTLGVVAFLTMLPAIRVEGNWPLWVDPGWIEGIATAWALAGAAWVITIELRRDRDQYLLDVASGYPTWEIDPADGQRIVVNNYGRFPIHDVIVMEFDYETQQARTMWSSAGMPVPIGPGGRVVTAQGMDNVAGVPLTLYFTASANGHRYRRRPDGKLDDLGLVV